MPGLKNIQTPGMLKRYNDRHPGLSFFKSVLKIALVEKT
jgi:hypothetical protein